jgi:hypothetical protein
MWFLHIFAGFSCQPLAHDLLRRPAGWAWIISFWTFSERLMKIVLLLLIVPKWNTDRKTDHMLGDLWICVRPTSETCLWKITEPFSREIMVQNPAEIYRTTHQLCLDSEYPEIATFTCIYICTPWLTYLHNVYLELASLQVWEPLQEQETVKFRCPFSKKTSCFWYTRPDLDGLYMYIINTYIHACMHTYIQTDIQTYIYSLFTYPYMYTHLSFYNIHIHYIFTHIIYIYTYIFIFLYIYINRHTPDVFIYMYPIYTFFLPFIYVYMYLYMHIQFFLWFFISNISNLFLHIEYF